MTSRNVTIFSRRSGWIEVHMNPTNLSLTQVRRDNQAEPQQRPLEFGLIRRMFTYTRPYAWKRNLLVLLTLTRACQLPLLAWAVGSAISGPIAQGKPDLLVASVLAYAALAFFTDFVFHFGSVSRSRWANRSCTTCAMSFSCICRSCP